MATYELGKIGEGADRVRLKINGTDVLIAEQYEVTCSLFNQPASFSITVGDANTARTIIERYQPGMPFQLLIGDVPQFTGVLDDPSAEGSIGGTRVTLRGRDASAPLHDDHVSAEQSFTDPTYVSLVRKQLDAVGLEGRTIQTSNRANRRIRAGVPINELAGPARSPVEILTHATGTPGVTHQEIRCRMHERRWEFLMRYLQLAALFLWTTADGQFVLSEPNVKQSPTSTILHRPNMSRLETNIISWSWQNKTQHRYSEYVIYGRATGGKNGHAKALGSYVDTEMQGLGFTKRKVIRATNARTKEQAMFLARRMCAEDRRNGSQLSYVVAGHTNPFVGGNQRAVWTPDTIHTINDAVVGVFEPMYLTDCTYRGSSQGTTTTLVFQRPADQIWSSDIT